MVRGSLIRLAAVAAAIVALTCLQPAVLAACSSRASGPLVSITRTHGLIIRLAIPRRRYPAYSIANTSITIRNQTEKPIGVLYVQAEVVDSHGGVLYPPAFSGQQEGDGPGPIWPICPRDKHACVKPGKTLRFVSMVLLRGSIVQPSLIVAASRNHWPSLQGKRIILHTSPAESRHIRITTKGATLIAHVLPVPSHAGSLYSAESFSCRESDGDEESGNQPGFWSHQSGSTLAIKTKTCKKGYSWHFVAGWIGHTAIEVRA